MDTTNLIAWLPFDDSPTEDLCGNTWTAYGNPTIGTSGAIFDNALQLNGSNYLKMDGGITLGGQDFTIRGQAQMDAATTQSWGGLFALNGNNLRIIRYNTLNDAVEIGYKRGLARVNLPASLTSRFHFELDYQHSTGKWFTFFNGVLVHTYTNSLERTTYSDVFVGGNGDNGSGGNKWSGSIDEFQIYDGVALHTENFTPPTADDYWVDGATANVTVDVQRKVHNPPLEWRYENAGDADDLILTAPILRDLPATQSKTGTAFYQTTRAKCFDLPATSEVWMKFDVYCNGSQRWRAYNGGNNGYTGLTVQTTGHLDYFCNDNGVYEVAGVAARLRVQTILVHMISGASAGIIEAWADGDFIYRYTGDVNHGQTFADIYLQSDGSGTFFSNVIISNAPIDLDEDVSQGEVLKVDVQRNVTNSGTVLADVQRRIILPGEVTIDLQRVITNETNQILVDVQRNVTNSGVVLADVQRALTHGGALRVDVQRRVSKHLETLADLQRNLINCGETFIDLIRNVRNVTVSERMLSRVSPVYDNSTFMKSFFNALGNEWAPLRHYFTTLREQRFISTVDWGIEYLEHKYSVTPDRTLTLDERRARLGIKAFKKYPLNPAVLEKYARDFCGLEVYLDESDAGFIWIIAAELTAQGYKDFMTFLRREKPAHLALAMLLHMSRYVGTPDTNEPTDDLNLPKVYAGVVSTIRGKITVKLPRLKNESFKIYAGVVSTIRGKISTIARLPDSPPQNQRLNLYAGNVMTVRGKISTSTRTLN